MRKWELPLTLHSFSALGGLTALLVALAAACGGGGTSVPACRTDAETEPLPSVEASLTMKVGSYEGNGSSQCIKGVGFQPILVIIKGDTNEWAVWHSSSMEEDSTADFAGAQPNAEDAITSLDPDAFSLSKALAVNAEGVVYHYVAFADSPDIRVGSYAGDGTEERSITDVGFQPVLVFLKGDGGVPAVWHSTAHPEGVASLFRGANATDLIQTFEADGFQLGSAGPIVNNIQGSTYHYVAFRNVPGQLATGSYVGDSSASRDITDIGFQPDYVWIKSSDATGGAHRTSSMSGDATLRFWSDRIVTDEIKALQLDGFRVGSTPTVNSDGETYYYAAWKASSGP